MAAARDPLAVRPEDVRRSLHAKVSELLVRRLRMALFLTLGSYGLFLVHDLLLQPGVLHRLVAIKVAQFGFAGAALWALRTQSVRRHAVGFALFVALVVAFAATVSAIERGNTDAHILLLAALTTTSAMLLPWGTRAQASLVAACLGLVCWNLHAVEGAGAAALLDPNVAALVTAQAVSLYVASDGARYRWRIEEQELGLRLREEHFRSLIENGSDLIVVAGADGLIRSASASLRRLLGHEPRDWIGRSLFDVVHPEDAGALREAVAASTISGPAPASVEVRMCDAAAEWHVLLGSLTDLLPDEAVGGIVLSARDITRRKAIETELQRSEAALSALIESTTDSVWSVDRERRLTAMNHAVRDSFAQVYGMEVQLGQSFEERVPRELAAEWRALYDRVLAGERVSSEQAFERDGMKRHYLISMNPIREHGEVTGAVVFSRDITDLRATEELARRNQADLTHVLRLGTMGEIASGLAHEINQPLGAIANYAAACARWLAAGPGASADVQRGLEAISAEALRAGEVIRRLRSLARKEEASLDMIDLNEAVASAVALVEPEARLQGIAVRFEPARELPRLYADPIQIEQVVLNLVLNAIEAMQSSSEKRLSIRTAQQGARACVAVGDSGAGLDPAAAGRVFEPFFTTKSTGLGMGLAISRRIVEAHGGALTGAANEGGAGSTFTFTLPLPA